jgi:hypothetical protein
MKYLKKFNESLEDIDSICKKYGIQNYTINGDGTVDVDGNVDLYNRGLTKLPLKFGRVTGNFYCHSNKLTTLEGCPNTINQCQWQLQKFNINNVDCVNTEFSSHLKTYNLQPTTYNLIYFDGNHSKKATLEYFELLLPTLTNDAVWIFDDIHWSKDMEEAWEIIKNHSKVKVTIDTFQWGIVFFRKEQEKEHFVIRT